MDTDKITAKDSPPTVKPLLTGWAVRAVTGIAALALAAMAFTGNYLATNDVARNACVSAVANWDAAVTEQSQAAGRARAALALVAGGDATTGTAGFGATDTGKADVAAVQAALDALTPADAPAPACATSDDAAAIRLGLAGVDAQTAALTAAVDQLAADLAAWQAKTLCAKAMDAATTAAKANADAIQAAKDALAAAAATNGYAASAGAQALIDAVTADAALTPADVPTTCVTADDAYGIEATTADVQARTDRINADVKALTDSLGAYQDSSNPTTPKTEKPPTPTAKKDYCPNGDYSGSRYDGKCGTKPKTTTPAKPPTGGTCPAGQVKNSAGKCVLRGGTPPKPTCPAGTTLHCKAVPGSDTPQCWCA